MDGHLCENDPKYVSDNGKKLKLTSWANAHVDACCLRFKLMFSETSVGVYSYGALNSDEVYNSNYLAFVNDAGTLSEKEKVEIMTKTINALPSTFSGALAVLLKMKGMSTLDAALATHLNERTITRLIKTERDNYSFDIVLAVCFGLHLAPWLSELMIEKAGLKFRNLPNQNAYKIALSCMFMDSIDDVQKFLQNAGTAPLKLNPSDEGAVMEK